MRKTSRGLFLLAIAAVGAPLIALACDGGGNSSGGTGSTATDGGGVGDGAAPATGERSCNATATGCECTIGATKNETECFARTDSEICCVEPDGTRCGCGTKQERPPVCYTAPDPSSRDGGRSCRCDKGPMPSGATATTKCIPAPQPAPSGPTTPPPIARCFSGPNYCVCTSDGRIPQGETAQFECPTANSKILGCPAGKTEQKSCDGKCHPEVCKGSAGERCDITGCVDLEFTCFGLGTRDERCGTIAVP